MNTTPAGGAKTLLGLPPSLIWGYLAVAVFMTGDGLEQAFLSKFMVDEGFAPQQASLLFTVYGLIVAVAAFASGVLAEYFGPRRVMAVATVAWIVFHVGFLVSLEQQNFALVLLFYSIRAVAYPVFIYGFVVWITYSAPQAKLSSAMGWFWCMYSVGIGILGTYLPSFTIPWIGEMATLWMALGFIAAGGLMAAFLIKDRLQQTNPRNQSTSLAGAMLVAVKLYRQEPQFVLATILRVINQLSLFGFVVVMPIVFTRDFGFTTSEWLQVWGLVYLTTVFTNLMWGLLGDRIGWVRQVKWYGCVGMAIATVLFYYVPSWAGDSFWAASAMSVLFGIAIAAFVPMSAIFPSLAPHAKGAAVSLHNLSAGLSSFVGPAIATVLWPVIGTAGVVWTYAGIYLLGAVLANFMKVDQNAAAEFEAGRGPRPAESSNPGRSQMETSNANHS